MSPFLFHILNFEFDWVGKFLMRQLVSCNIVNFVFISTQ